MRITLMKLLPFRIFWPLCWNFFIWSIRSVFLALSTSTRRKAVMLTLLYLKSSKSIDSMSYKSSPAIIINSIFISYDREGRGKHRTNTKKMCGKKCTTRKPRRFIENNVFAERNIMDCALFVKLSRVKKTRPKSGR